MSNLLGGDDDDVTGRTGLGDKLDCPIRGLRCGMAGRRSLLAPLTGLLLLLLSDAASSESCLPTGCDRHLLTSRGDGDLRRLLKLSIEVDRLTALASVTADFVVNVLELVTKGCC